MQHKSFGMYVCVMSNESTGDLFNLYIIFLSIIVQIPHIRPTTQNETKNTRHRLEQLKKR